MSSIWLGIETTTRQASVGLWGAPGLPPAVRLDADLATSEDLLPAISRLLASASLDGAGLSGIGVSLGPGSYTGLRIGAASGMGLAAGWGVPARGVPTFRQIASGAPRGAPVLATIPARAGEVFACAYGDPDPFSVSILPQGIYETPAVEAWMSSHPGASARGFRYGEDRLPRGVVETAPDAVETARLASVLFERDGAEPFLRPLYLRSFRQKAGPGAS